MSSKRRKTYLTPFRQEICYFIPSHDTKMIYSYSKFYEELQIKQDSTSRIYMVSKIHQKDFSDGDMVDKIFDPKEGAKNKVKQILYTAIKSITILKLHEMMGKWWMHMHDKMNEDVRKPYLKRNIAQYLTCKCLNISKNIMMNKLNRKIEQIQLNSDDFLLEYRKECQIFELCIKGVNYYLPKEMILEILTYLQPDSSFINTVGLVCIDFYMIALELFAKSNEFVVKHNRVYSIPLIVLNHLKVATIHGFRQNIREFYAQDMKYLISQLHSIQKMTIKFVHTETFYKAFRRKPQTIWWNLKTLIIDDRNTRNALYKFPDTKIIFPNLSRLVIPFWYLSMHNEQRKVNIWNRITHLTLTDSEVFRNHDEFDVQNCLAPFQNLENLEIHLGKKRIVNPSYLEKLTRLKSISLRHSQEFLENINTTVGFPELNQLTHFSIMIHRRKTEYLMHECERFRYAFDEYVQIPTYFGYTKFKYLKIFEYFVSVPFQDLEIFDQKFLITVFQMFQFLEIFKFVVRTYPILDNLFIYNLLNNEDGEKEESQKNLVLDFGKASKCLRNLNLTFYERLREFVFSIECDFRAVKSIIWPKNDDLDSNIKFSEKRGGGVVKRLENLGNLFLLNKGITMIPKQQKFVLEVCNTVDQYVYYIGDEVNMWKSSCELKYLNDHEVSIIEKSYDID